MNYSACWRSRKALISTAHVKPLIPGQRIIIIIIIYISTPDNINKVQQTDT
jgi:hypothetical protein